MKPSIYHILGESPLFTALSKSTMGGLEGSTISNGDKTKAKAPNFRSKEFKASTCMKYLQIS